jgi:hypothetical protein
MMPGVRLRRRRTCGFIVVSRYTQPRIESQRKADRENLTAGRYLTADSPQRGVINGG